MVSVLELVILILPRSPLDLLTRPWKVPITVSEGGLGTNLRGSIEIAAVAAKYPESTCQRDAYLHSTQFSHVP